MAHMTDVLKKPVLTEKSLALQTEENKYTFDVDSVSYTHLRAHET